MLRMRLLALSFLMLVVAGLGAARAGAVPQAQRAQAPALQLPTIPDPAPVQLDASKTAFLVLDLLDTNCAPSPRCVALLPNVASGLAAARAAGVLVAYSTSSSVNILPDVAPLPGDPIVNAHGNKFYGSKLDDILKQAGVTTVVITGSGASGAVLYTAFGANERGYTAVVAEDGVASSSDFVELYSRYQMLIQSGFANTDNTPLKPNAIHSVERT